MSRVRTWDGDRPVAPGESVTQWIDRLKGGDQEAVQRLFAGLGRLAEAPLVVGGVPVPDFYAPDGFHPATVSRGLPGNAVLEAFAMA